MAPLAICSVLLILTCFAIWTGMYQYQAAEAAQTDVAALATADTTNHFVVVLLWFVPVTFAVLAAIWYRRWRTNAEQRGASR
jgi:heme/copper-type cytochrome/quinol oxidase subunit 2